MSGYRPEQLLVVAARIDADGDDRRTRVLPVPSVRAVEGRHERAVARLLLASLPIAREGIGWIIRSLAVHVEVDRCRRFPREDEAFSAAHLRLDFHARVRLEDH